MTTFVTAFIDLREDRSKDRSYETCFDYFRKLASTNINLVLFTSKCFVEVLSKINPKILIIETELEDLPAYKTASKISNLRLPINRTSYHDTLNFMILMNAKIELVQQVMELNPFKTEQFSWIDFSICHVINQPEISLPFLYSLSQTKLKPGIFLPGCWPRGYAVQLVNQAVNWRFCGGFFIGDKESLEEFYRIHVKVYTDTLTKFQTMVWEVNFWCYYEVFCGWKPIWFKADHNDTIIRVPSLYFRTVASLTTIPSRMETFCRKTLNSLIPQVDTIYLSLAKEYKRFPGEYLIPQYLSQEPYLSKVKVVVGEDYGPATKYLGALKEIPAQTWIFFCDDDQEYHPELLAKMKSKIVNFGVYQNRYKIISQDTSGGLIHGYVGNLTNSELVRDLINFPLPECSRHVDDQWMSIYYFLKGISIYSTEIENYSDIYQTLEDGREIIGTDSLAALKTRDERVKELAQYFQIKFVENGGIVKITDTF